MSLHRWLQNLCTGLAPGRTERQHRQRGSLRAATRRLHVETLEDRLTPSFSWSGNYSEIPPNVVMEPPPLSADFTNDGIPDLISTTSYGYGLAVQPGLGDGTFAAPIHTYTSFVEYFAAADFNGDGRLDVFTTGRGGGASDYADTAFGNLLLGRGDGTFFGHETVELGVFAPTRIGTGDVDGNGSTYVAIQGIDLGGLGVVVVGLNNDDRLSLWINDVTVTEGNTGISSATFTVTLSAASTQTVTVDFATADVTASAGSDYQAAGGTLTFAPGETSKTIDVLVNGDCLGESNETFAVNLSSPTNATIADGQAVGTILDDEPPLSLSDASLVLEGDSGTTAMSFLLTLSAAYDVDITVDFTTQDGSATTADNAYQFASGTATIVAGSTTAAIVIDVNGDEKAEMDETLSVQLSNAAGARITDGQASGTITNDDAAPTKFYVVDSSADRTYEYEESGAAVENYRLRSGNNDPRGAASYAGGDRVWVIDNDDYVYVYDAAGNALGYWKAKGLSTPEGIASDGTDLWIVDRGKDKVLRYAGAASRTSGSASATSSFTLHSGNREAKGIETDGTYLWVVNNTSTDKVFKYTVGGTLVGSWTLTGGVTLDPSNPSDIWIVDASADDVFQYSGAANRTSGSQAADAVFALASGNRNPQGPGDPPPAAGQASIQTQSAWTTDLAGTMAEAQAPVERATLPTKETPLSARQRPSASAGAPARSFALRAIVREAFNPGRKKIDRFQVGDAVFADREGLDPIRIHDLV